MLSKTPDWPELQAPPRARRPRRGARGARRRRTVGAVAVSVSLVIAAGGAYASGLFDPGTRAAEPRPVAAGAEAAGAEAAGAGPATGETGGDTGTDGRDPAARDTDGDTAAAAPADEPAREAASVPADRAADEPAAAPAEEAADAAAGATTPGGTCPEPDQVWSAENGHLAPSELAQIPFAPGHSVRSDVVGGLAELNEAYAAEFGVNLTVNSSYRTYAEQESLYDPSSTTAAPPGCSNHGTGLAIDIGGGVEAFGSAQYDWLKANAEAYGWVHPPFAEPSGRNPEPWHWQSVQAPNSY